MIARVAVVPQPPLLVPELVAGARVATDEVRAACRSAVTSLAERTDKWVAIGVDSTGPVTFGPNTSGNFAGYGVPLPVSLAEIAGPQVLGVPLPVLIAGWLREQAGAREVQVWLLSATATAEESRAMGIELAGLPEEVGVLVLADGSSFHGKQSPIGPDPRATVLDEEVADALRAADPAALLAVDAGRARSLGMPGIIALHALAAATADHQYRGTVLYSHAPLGVGYHVATWEAV